MKTKTFELLNMTLGYSSLSLSETLKIIKL